MNISHEFFMKIMFYTNMVIILMIIYNKNISPLNFMMTLILFTLIYLILIYLINQNSMYCYMIFISMISGNMIMFLYFTSLINNYYNKSFKSNLKFIWFMLIFSVMLIFMIYYFNIPIYNKMNNSPLLFHKIYIYPLFTVTILTIIYMLFTLLYSTKICLSKYKSLRKIVN